MSFETFSLAIENYVAQVVFNRPERANALNQKAWQEMKAIFEELDENEDVRAIILRGNGRHFCAGIDLELLMQVAQSAQKCEGRKREKLRRQVLDLQAPINAIEQCSKPVLAAIHGGCIGGGVDIVSACDMRYCTHDAFFTIKEIDMGMVADLGTLQRLPKIIPPGIAREMAYTGRNVSGKEAERIGLTNRSFVDADSMLAEVMNIAQVIAAKSPLSIRGTKAILNHSRDHSVADGLEYMATWNAAMLLSDDLTEAFQAKMQKRDAAFR
ncbi:crotonase/enoyl-CoA hydratase family protein [Runella salmonicolor]|uniref:Crotonase/enoyl-CoA hydratase family protein n=1 Tax=Runella salmonicolor TaxID=2950278 RepID=A0ABT1FSN3_9BACT|nr:crotonase/enoyl-CoA hydratase family protein [Runella salmonicolor]MCP1384774.1 crotonase/enoyl-CoA hydratase family protein [Runella salmonicolor]